jgi:NAD(P)-dependent dehydrogenase (short-subunit alcohol dehydrogenase family)
VGWSIDGKRVLLTGATSGIGLEASVALARQGARVVMVGRDRAKTEDAVATVAARSGAKPEAYLLCDFSSQAQVRSLAREVLDRFDRIDVLVNNAGGVNKTRRLTVDGVEATFAVNPSARAASAGRCRDCGLGASRLAPRHFPPSWPTSPATIVVSSPGSTGFGTCML